MKLSQETSNILGLITETPTPYTVTVPEAKLQNTYEMSHSPQFRTLESVGGLEGLFYICLFTTLFIYIFVTMIDGIKRSVKTTIDTKRTILTLEELTDIIHYITLMSLAYRSKTGEYCSDELLKEFYTRRLKSYSAEPPFWHTSKIILAAKEMSRMIVSNKKLYKKINTSLNKDSDHEKDKVHSILLPIAKEYSIKTGLN